MKIGLIAAVSTIAGALAFASFTSTSDADEPCQRTDFKTEMVRDACKAGGQKAAKDVMKKFNKDNNIKSCNQCHSKLAPTYELKDDGLEQFAKLGGKLIDAKGGAKAKDAPKAAPKAEGKGGGGGAGTGGGGGAGTGGGGGKPPAK